MRIGIFSTNFPHKAPDERVLAQSVSHVAGGVGEVAFQYCVHLAKRCHQVTVFTSSEDSLTHREEYENVIILRYKKDFLMQNTGISLSYLTQRWNIPIDLVHLHAGSPPATIAALNLVHQQAVPLVVSHHYDPIATFSNPLYRSMVAFYGWWYLRKAFKRSSAIVVSNPELPKISPVLQEFAEKIRIIPFGVNLSDFILQESKESIKKRLGIPRDHHVILFVGSLTERKGPHVLLKAFSIVKKEIPNSRLILVGKYTPFLHHIQQLQKELYLTDDVVLTGAVDDRTKIEYYATADLFVLPSFYETFGIVLLEASAASLPLIVSDLEVFQSLVQDRINGRITRRGDPRDLAEKILELLKDEKLRLHMGTRAQDKAREYSWEKSTDQIERLYQEILNP